MSFLLDALRKTEDQKHRREVPTIHSADPAPDSRPARRFMGPYLLVLLPAFFVLAWFGSRQFADSGSGEAQPAPAKPVVAAPGVEDPRSGPAVTPTGEMAELPWPGPVASRIDEALESPADGLPATVRTPVESLPAPAVEEPGQSGSANIASGEAPIVVGPQPGPVTDDAVPTPQGSEPYQPPRPSFITYWQLPDSIRAELPEFRVRVMVYAERPEDRFILVNGQRLLEGDSLQPGLVVREIRRDGVVFSYRLYEFLVTR